MRSASFFLDTAYTEDMRVIAIDPGYGRCGVAIVEKNEGKDAWIYSDCIETQAKDGFVERLAQIVAECERLIEKHKPDALAMERLFFNNNQKTAMQVAEVRGAILNAAAVAGIPSFEYTPGQVKSATSGYGRADKKQIITMVNMLLKIDKAVKHDDEYDAIAVGITHLAHAR
jgi:crossover junction endodeoxyribonuclease RuvC